MGDFDDFDFNELVTFGEPDDLIEIVADHRGVGLQSDQSAKRLKDVRRDIDRVYALREDVDGLFAFAGDVMRAPESRLFAAAKLEALWNEATERRWQRPLFDRAKLAVLVNALDSKEWRHPFCYGTILDHRDGVRREIPLDD